MRSGHSRTIARTRWVVLGVGLAAIVGAAIGLVWYWNLLNRLKPVSAEFRPGWFRLAPGTSAAQLAQILKKQGAIRDADAFLLWLRWKRWDRRIQSGDYELSPSMSAIEIGRMFAEHRITRNWILIHEGLTARQIARRLAAHGACDEAEFMQAVRNPRSFRTLFKALADAPTLEGYLFPAFYRLPPGIGASKAVQVMLSRFGQGLKPLERELRDSPRALHQSLTVASMIEREAMMQKDRPLIASVIYNRLKKGMRLQIDATVQYALGYWKPRLLYADLEVESPYNTYRRAGLPPGPICSPGIACIEAALNPASTNYLYYVALPTGYHLFTSSYEDHLQAVKKAREARKLQAAQNAT